MHIHKLQSGKATELLLTINDSEYVELLPAFKIYKSRTGVFIDHFKDLKLSSGTQPLIDVLSLRSEGSKIHRSLISVLEQSELHGYGVIFVGD